MTVRGARLDDARAIARIHVDGWRAAYAGILADEVLAAQSVDRREGQWREWIPLGRALVAEHEGEVVGFAGILAETGEIAALYVDPRHWRRGAGRALTRAAMQRLRVAGCDHVALWVFEANQSARAFYAALGFAPDGAVSIHERGVPQLRLCAGLEGTL